MYLSRASLFCWVRYSCMSYGNSQKAYSSSSSNNYGNGLYDFSNHGDHVDWEQFDQNDSHESAAGQVPYHESPHRANVLRRQTTPAAAAAAAVYQQAPPNPVFVPEQLPPPPQQQQQQQFYNNNNATTFASQSHATYTTTNTTTAIPIAPAAPPSLPPPLVDDTDTVQRLVDRMTPWWKRWHPVATLVLLGVCVVLAVIVAVLASSQSNLAAQVQLHKATVIDAMASSRYAEGTKNSNGTAFALNANQTAALIDAAADAALERMVNRVSAAKRDARRRRTPIEDALDQIIDSSTRPHVYFYSFRIPLLQQSDAAAANNETKIQEDRSIGLPDFDAILNYDVCCRLGDAVACARGVEFDTQLPSFSARLRKEQGTKFLSLRTHPSSAFSGKTCWLRYELAHDVDEK